MKVKEVIIQKHAFGYCICYQNSGWNIVIIQIWSNMEL